VFLFHLFLFLLLLLLLLLLLPHLSRSQVSDTSVLGQIDLTTTRRRRKKRD
jgi:hypothetical protein